MAIRFVCDFLLPLVRGGTVRVGRPLGARSVEALVSRWTRPRRGELRDASDPDEDAAAELAQARHARARALLADASPPPLDETTLRLGATAYNLLALAHPDLGGFGADRRWGRIVEATSAFATVGVPPTATEAVRRHSLLCRLSDVTRTEHTVQFWAGKRLFVGRPPPGRVLALPRLRRVSSGSVRRLLLKEVGVPPPAQRLLAVLYAANPLGEALEPLRLTPPVAWERMFPALRFPALCRVAVGRVLELGVEPAGNALVAALLRFASMRQTAAGQAPRPAEAAFAIRFLAHTVWLHQLFEGGDLAPTSDLAALLAAASEVDERLVWPPDVPRGGPVGAAFAAQLATLRSRVPAAAPEKHQAAAAACRFALGAA